ncbi:DUF4124 domain-containing protein [Methyloglobulus sp.]|uniref:DUF4124 domain-containing protein n=1 Tax=Methyloglobulus sp. TaxID=2518622 RepID=UPI003989B51A
MRHMSHISVLLVAFSLAANAEVFKCKQVSGKISYQPTPCTSEATPQGVIKVKKMASEEAEAAKARLKAWQEEQAASDAAKKEAEKQRQAELEKQESLELQRRSVIAQEQQAIAEQRRQQQLNRPIYVAPYFNRYWDYGYHLPHKQWGPPVSPPPTPEPLHGSPFTHPHEPITHPHKPVTHPHEPNTHPHEPGFGSLEDHR